MSRWYDIEDRDRMVRQTLFVCPRCGLDRDGTVVEPRRWATAFGVPILPLGKRSPMLSCNVCEHRSDLGVLDIPTTEVLAAYLSDATRHAVVAVARAGLGPDTELDQAVRDLAVDTMLMDGFRYDDERLDDDLTGLDDVGAAHALAKLSSEMTVHGKQAFLHRLTNVALADGPITERERSTLVDLGVALRMPAQHINDVITVADLVSEAA